jgi:hypothetical protein
MTRHFSLAVVLLLEFYHCLPSHSTEGTVQLTSPPRKTERRLQAPSDDDFIWQWLRLLGDKFTIKSTIFRGGWGRQKQPYLKNQEEVDEIQNATQIRRGDTVQVDSSFEPELENHINLGHGRGDHHYFREENNYPGSQRSRSSIRGGVEDIGNTAGGHCPYLVLLFCRGERTPTNFCCTHFPSS